MKYEDILAWWKKEDTATKEDIYTVLDNFKVLFAYHSGNIENETITLHDTREIFEHDGVTSYTGDLRTLFEIRNSKEANEYFLSSFNQKLPITEELIKEFQRLLTQNTYDTRRYQLGERPGEYKKHDFVTGREEIGALPDDVKEEIDELLEEIQDIPEDIVLKAAAYFHAKFENIHPFADGNGRTGRLVMNYLLVLNSHPPIVIHEEDRKSYYDALEAWDREQDIVPMCTFLKEQTVKTWAKQIERAERKRSDLDR